MSMHAGSVRNSHLEHNSNINHPPPPQEPIGNALATLSFKDLRKQIESLGLAFNMCCKDSKSY